MYLGVFHGLSPVNQMVDQKLFESAESIFDLSPISQISDLICGAAAHCGRVMHDTREWKMSPGKESVAYEDEDQPYMEYI